MKKFLNKFMNKKGFTLTELMVVVVIMGILVAVAVPIYNNVTDDAMETAANATARTITSAVTQIAAQNAIKQTDLKVDFTAADTDKGTKVVGTIASKENATPVVSAKIEDYVIATYDGTYTFEMDATGTCIAKK